MKAYRVLLVLAILVLGVMMVPALLRAQGPGEVTVNDVASELYCPLCAGLTVDVCELDVCDEMKLTIGEKLAAGEEPEAIKAYFVEQYGQSVVGKPSTEGFHLAAWLMPIIGLLAALAVLAFWLRSRGVPPASVPVERPRQPVGGSDYEAQLERELRRME